MRRSLVFTCNDRPEFLGPTLDSWSGVRGLSEWSKHIFVEPSPQQQKVLGVLAHFDSLGINIHLNAQQNGVLHNPWVALNTAFEDRTDFAVLAEDDIVVSSDIVEYFNAASALYGPQRFLGVSAYTSTVRGDPAKMLRAPGFGGLVWGTWRQSWVEHLRDTWDHDYSTHNGIPGIEAGWDWNINTRIMRDTGKRFISPDVSRSRHIGRYGTHIRAEDFERTSPSPSFEYDRAPVEFYDGGDYS